MNESGYWVMEKHVGTAWVMDKNAPLHMGTGYRVMDKHVCTGYWMYVCRYCLMDKHVGIFKYLFIVNEI